MINIEATMVINKRYIINYIFIGSISLLLGYFLKNYIFLLPLSVFTYLVIKNKADNVLLYLILWAFIYSYYQGQGWVSNVYIIKYALKPNIYAILCLFLYHKKLCCRLSISKKLTIWALIAGLMVLSNDLYYLKLTTGAITYPVSIYIFLLILQVPKSKYFNNRLFNMLLAVGILQLLISILQVTDTIPRPLSLHSQMHGGNTVSGFDDAATGTMGVGRSNVTSWIGTVIVLFLLSFSLRKKKLNIAIISLIFLLQYATVDSKTALGLTLVGIIYLFARYRLSKILLTKNILILIAIIIGVLGLRNLVNMYYVNTIARGVTLDSRIEGVSSTREVIIKDPWSWGKIAGFVNLTNDFLSKNRSQIIFGYGHGQYNYEIEEQDVFEMQRNNILRSRSTVIKMYAEFGLMGVALLFGLYQILRREIKHMKFKTPLGESFSNSGLVICDMSFLFMFLYGGHDFRDAAFLMFLLVYALVLRNDGSVRQ